jgi:hypothetical protein
VAAQRCCSVEIIGGREGLLPSTLSTSSQNERLIFGTTYNNVVVFIPVQ